MDQTNPAMNLRRIDLNLLVVFEAVVTEASVSRAAHRLHLTQSAMSHALSRLRDAFGDAILERNGRTMRATPRALAMLPEVRALLTQAGRLFAQGGRFDPATVERHVHIGTSDYAAITVLAGRLAEVQRDAPAMHLKLHHAGRVDAPAMLRSGQIDLAFGVLNNLTPDLATVPLLDEPYLCAVSPGQPTPATLDDYLLADHLNVMVQGDTLGLVDEALAQKGLARRIALTVPHFETAVALLAGTRMLLTAPAGLLQPAAAQGRVALFEPPLVLPAFRTQMAWARRTEDDEGLRWLRNAIATDLKPGGQAPISR